MTTTFHPEKQKSNTWKMTRKKNAPDFSGNLLSKLFGDFSSLLRSYHGYDANSQLCKC